MGLTLLALCLGAVAFVIQQEPGLGGYTVSVAAKETSSVSASQKGKDTSSASNDSLVKNARHLRSLAPQAGNRAHSSGVGLTNHMVDNASFNSTYPLTYDANGGTGTPSAKADTGYGAVACTSQHAFGETVTLPTGATGDCQGIVPTRDGMEFVGWSPTKLAPFDTLSDAKTHVVTTVTMPPTRQTMYAVWARGGETPTSYTVTFKTQMNANGEAANPAITLTSVSVTSGRTIPSSAIPADPAAYNPGIKFMGWGLGRGDGDDYDAGEGLLPPFDPTTEPVTESIARPDTVADGAGVVYIWPM